MEKKAKTKHAVDIVKMNSQLECVSQDSESWDSQRDVQSRGNPISQVLGSIRRERFTQSTLRQASIRENKGPSLGKMQVKSPHQRSPYATKIRGSVPRGDCKTRAIRPKQGKESHQQYLQA